MSNKTTQRIAKSTATGLFFDGTAFNADIKNAVEIPDGISSEDFKASWSGPVEVLTRKQAAKQCPNFANWSLAEKIYYGALTEYDAAREYVITRRRDFGNKSFSIRTASGDYITRVVKVEQKGIERHAYINFCGNIVVLVWRGGELAVEWA